MAALSHDRVSPALSVIAALASLWVLPCMARSERNSGEPFGPEERQKATVEAHDEQGLAIARWRPVIAEASRRFGVPQSWITAVMRAESGGRTRLGGRPIVSRAGAMGVMQLMPGTWAAMREAHGLGSDPHDPRDNVLAGAAYLRAMYDRFGYPGLFAAYNAGPARYDEHVRTGRTLPAETRSYSMQVLGHIEAGPAVSARASGAMAYRAIATPAVVSGTSLFFELGQAARRPRDPAPSGSPINQRGDDGREAPE